MGNKRRRGQPGAEDAAAEPLTQEDRPQSAAAEPATKKPRVEASRSLFVRSLPPSATADTLTDFFSQHFPIKHATVITDPATKASRGYGFVTFTDADDCKDAKAKLHKQKLDGRPLILEVAEPRHRQPGPQNADAQAKKDQRQAELTEARKAPKLIVRNLPWSIKTSDQLAQLFRMHGLVKFADLPNNKGKLSGFGFVTLRGRKNAQQAIDAINGKTVDGRTLAVDWAVDKKQWSTERAKDEDEKPKSKPTKKSKKQDEPSDDEDESESKDSAPKKNLTEDEQLEEDMKNFFKNHGENLEDEDSKDEDDDEDDEDNEDDEDEDEAEDGSDDGDAESDEEADDGAASEATAKPAQKPLTDNSTTLFIRNLPFNTTDADLKAHFEKFGPVRYARIVMDRAMDRPAGTGFVCMIKEDDFKECLRGAPRQAQAQEAVMNKKSILQNEMADATGRYTLDGRVLQVTQAVSKGEATRLAETGLAARQGKADKDKRRLYLLAEGAINPGTPLHALLPAAEVKMRDQSAAQRKKMIQGNPSLHLSLTRLAIRNMPRDIDSKKLKALAREAVVGFASDVKEGKREPISKEENARGGDEDREAEHRRREKGKGVVKQAKIVFENKEGSKVAEADGAGRSRGYGFIEYSSHRWALMGLRWLNGHALDHPTSGKPMRLIAEFAIENANVIRRRGDLQSRAASHGKNPNSEAVEGHENYSGPGNDDAGRFGAGGRGGSGRGGRGGARGGARGGRDGGGRGGGAGRDGGRGAPPAPKGKDFAVSKDKRQYKNGKRVVGEGGDAGRAGEAPQDSMKQQIIGRKRMMRKKKSQTRG